jgi:hypothetical protein
MLPVSDKWASKPSLCSIGRLLHLRDDVGSETSLFVEARCSSACRSLLDANQTLNDRAPQVGSELSKSQGRILCPSGRGTFRYHVDPVEVERDVVLDLSDPLVARLVSPHGFD